MLAILEIVVNVTDNTILLLQTSLIDTKESDVVLEIVICFLKINS
jgi:hypothetical protein